MEQLWLSSRHFAQAPWGLRRINKRVEPGDIHFDVVSLDAGSLESMFSEASRPGWTDLRLGKTASGEWYRGPHASSDWLEVTSEYIDQQRSIADRLEARVADWFSTRDFEVITAENSAHTPELGRLTHDTLRRISEVGLLAVVAAWTIYIITGVQVLHPVLAIVLTLVFCSFRLMASLMRRELSRVLYSPPSSGSKLFGPSRASRS